MTSTQPIQTEVAYLAFDVKYQHEKPYTVNYDTEDVFPKTNTLNELKPVLVQNFRSLQTPQSFIQYGFEVAKLRSALEPYEFENTDSVEKVFYAEVTHLLSQKFPSAARVEILEHQAPRETTNIQPLWIRKRHPEFPVATGQSYEHLLPTTLVHIDFTTYSAKTMSRAAFKAEPENYQRTLAVNIWKSLQGPGNDWPLALCDKRTVNHHSETVAHDIVSEDRFMENLRLYYTPKHQWYYFEGLQNDEVIIFQQMDSNVEGGGGVPHTGFPNPHVDAGAPPRVSIELRAFIYFN